MREFQGWEPKIIDNLTFDQLDAIFTELNSYHERIPPLDVTVEGIKRVIFKHLGVKEPKSGESTTGQLKNFPVVQATEEETQAWYKSKMKEPLKEFLKKYRKRK